MKITIECARAGGKTYLIRNVIIPGIVAQGRGYRYLTQTMGGRQTLVEYQDGNWPVEIIEKEGVGR